MLRARFHANPDDYRPQWVTCKKITDHSVTIIAENDVMGAGLSGVNVLCGNNDEFHVA